MKRIAILVIFAATSLAARAEPPKAPAPAKDTVDREDALAALLAAAEVREANVSLALAQLAQAGAEVVAYRQARAEEKQTAFGRAKARLRERYGIDPDHCWGQGQCEGWDGDALVEGAKLKVRRAPKK